MAPTHPQQGMAQPHSQDGGAPGRASVKERAENAAERGGRGP